MKKKTPPNLYAITLKNDILKETDSLYGKNIMGFELKFDKTGSLVGRFTGTKYDEIDRNNAFEKAADYAKNRGLKETEKNLRNKAKKINNLNTEQINRSNDNYFS